MATITKRTLPAKQNGRAAVRFVVRWRDGHGTQRHASFPKRADAEQFRDNLTVTAVTGQSAPDRRDPKGSQTFGEVRAAWTAARRVSNARTATEGALSGHLSDLDGMAVSAVLPSDVRAAVTKVSDAGLSAETASAVLRMCRQILDCALDDGLVPGNAAARVRAPRITRPPLDGDDVLSPAELGALVDAIGDQWRPLVTLLAYTGCRWSEALGVRARDVDLLRRRIHVGHQVLEEVAGHTTVRPGGKTRGSDRWVPLPAVVADELARHLGTVTGGPDSLIFVNTKGLSPLRGNFRRQVWIPALLKAGIGRAVPLRNLRHSAATMMLAAGMQPMDVARRLGHSRPTTTLNTYARFIPGTDDTATAAVDALISAHILRTSGS